MSSLLPWFLIRPQVGIKRTQDLTHRLHARRLPDSGGARYEVRVVFERQKPHVALPHVRKIHSAGVCRCRPACHPPASLDLRDPRSHACQPFGVPSCPIGKPHQVSPYGAYIYIQSCHRLNQTASCPSKPGSWVHQVRRNLSVLGLNAETRDRTPGRLRAHPVCRRPPRSLESSIYHQIPAVRKFSDAPASSGRRARPTCMGCQSPMPAMSRRSPSDSAALPSAPAARRSE